MLLSHYTSRRGLQGIANTMAFWATNFLTVNDSSEYFYAWEEIQRDAFEYALERLPADLVQPGTSAGALAAAGAQQLRAQLAAADGYGDLYVTSFALAKSREQKMNGILTLWDRYTKLEGYCLQYEKADVEHMVQLDSMKGNYAWVGLAPIEYGLEKETLTFRDLVMQVGEQFLLLVARQRGDGRVPLRLKDHWAPSYLTRKLMDYCGTHKHPAFEDEREFRILAYPLQQAEARVFTGIANRKTIHQGPAGKRHLVLGDDWRPGIEPKRIIIGPKADPNIEPILKLFRRPPAVSMCTIPIV